ncbi:MAG: apolipoprotein N-acyltransferase [Pseudomonadota bacterium]
MNALRNLLPARGSLLAVLAGGLNTLAFAPFGLWPLAVLSPLALYLLLRGLDVRTAFRRGFAYGFGFWLAGVSWVYVSIHVYGYTPVGMAVFLTLAFAALLALLFFAWWTALYAYLARGVLRPLPFVALWVLAEWVRSWLFTGFPWLYQGYAFIDTPLAGYAPTGGVLLLSAVVLAIAVLAADLAQGTRRARVVAALAIAGLVAGGALLGTLRWTEPAGRPLTVSLVQGNIPQDQKWLREMQQPTIDIYTGLTKDEWGRDIVIWPEAAIPKFMHEAWPVLESQAQLAAAGGSTFITGIPYVYQRNREYVFHNTVLAMRGPESFAMYHKANLVPFGEVVPFAPLLRAIAPFFSLQGIPLEGFTSGPDGQAPLPAKGHRLATFLCYEIVYADYVRRHAAAADVLLTLSNDAWFGSSHGPRQHFQIARMRALETGRWLVRDTNTGITAIVDDRGRVVARAEPFTRTVLRGEVQPMQGRTPFMITGEWPVLFGIAAVLAAAWRRRRT